MSKQISKPEDVNELVTSNILDRLDKIKNDKKKNFYTYKLFKKLQKFETVKVYPLNVEDNKNISEIVEDMPNEMLTELSNETSPEDMKATIDRYKERIKEMSKQVNEILSDKLLLEGPDKPFNINKINLLDYQFIILSIFTIMNQSIKYRFDVEKDKKVEELQKKVVEGTMDYPTYYKRLEDLQRVPLSPVTVSLPVNQVLLTKLREELSFNDEFVHTEKEKDYTVKLNYAIKKLSYDELKSPKGQDVVQEDFKDWLLHMEYELDENVKILFRPVGIEDYLDIYLGLTAMQIKFKYNQGKKLTKDLLEMNIDLFNKLILGISYNGELIDVNSDPRISDKIKEIFNSMTDNQIYDLTKLIYQNVFRFEIGIKIYDGETLIKEDAWYDTGLSFFFNS